MTTQKNGKDNVENWTDTEVAAIKAKTDALPATPASQGDVTGAHSTTDGKIDAVQADLGDYSAQTNLKSLLAALAIPDTAGKGLFIELATDRLDSATYGLSALNTDIDAIQTDLGDASGRSNSKTIVAMLGNPDTADCTVYGALGAEYVNANGAPEVDNVRAHLFKAGGFGGAVVSKTYTFNNDAAGAKNIFTVTGDVIVRIIPVVTTDVVPGSAANIKLGHVGDTGSMIAYTDATTLDARRIWIDTSCDSECEALSSMRDYIITDGNDVQIEISAQVNSGAILFYCIWTPLSSDGNVVAA